MPDVRTDNLDEAMRDAYPELDLVRREAEQPTYLVGGAVRDLLLGRGRGDIDLVVVGDAAGLAARLGVEPVEHERFATAKARLDGHEVDVASARTETYARPGALPEVRPAEDIASDLSRRDFSINAMALPLQGDIELIDPHGGREDLAAGLLRVLHERSFEDDPTRALRAARYAARFDFELAPETAALIADVDLTTVSADRRRAELLRLAAEPEAVRGLELLGEWGLVELAPDGAALAGQVIALCRRPPWRDIAEPARAVLEVALDPPGRELALVEANPSRPSQGLDLADGHSPVELISARVRGAEWLDRYLGEWSAVELEIDGADLIAAGIPQGPAVGEGLGEALRRKLDGEISGREDELRVALEAVRESR